MNFPPEFLQQIKDRLTLSEVIGQRVPLKREGREFKACCPFHREKTPSFTVNDVGGFYYCFGCGAHGDAIDFVRAHDNLPFRDAVKMLAAQAGLQLPVQTPQQAEADRQRERLYGLLDAATAWFGAQLTAPEYGHALDYLTERGITADQIRTFRLGFAPADGRLLRNHLWTQHYKNDEMIRVGVMRRSPKTNTVYCLFRDRIVFPVTDTRGKVVAFGGRLLPDTLRAPPQGNTTPPKYLNSGETPLFRKGKMLYGESQARKAAGAGRPLIVVEGYTDVLACHRAGFDAAVAPLGTALTEDQIARLWRMIPATEKIPVLCFDGDDAGRRAADRACERILPLLRPHHSARFAFLPEGQDPDTLIAQRGGAGFQAVIDRAIPLAELVWRRRAQGRRFDTPESRAGLEASLYKDIEAIGDDTVRHYYRQALEDKIGFFARRLEKVYSRLIHPMLIEPGVVPALARSHAG